MQALGEAVVYATSHALEIIGAAFVISIVIGLFREAITGKGTV